MAMIAANSAYRDVRVAELPIKGVVGWVDSLALQHDRDALPAAQEMEADARMIVAKKLGDFHASAAAALEALGVIENQELESYWEVLRAHALAHYVQERDVDEVLNELNERYVVANIERRQRAIESQADPYGHER
jgi:SH3-like domain-containing protein